PIANMLAPARDQAACSRWGIIQGVTVIVAALFLKAPPPNWLPGTWTPEKAGGDVKKRQTTADFTSGEMAATPHFWLMYVMIAMVATVGLMAPAQLNPTAIHFKFVTG